MSGADQARIKMKVGSIASPVNYLPATRRRFFVYLRAYFGSLRSICHEAFWLGRSQTELIHREPADLWRQQRFRGETQRAWMSSTKSLRRVSQEHREAPLADIDGLQLHRRVDLPRMIVRSQR
jgi:hypothetical protein